MQNAITVLLTTHKLTKTFFNLTNQVIKNYIIYILYIILYNYKVPCEHTILLTQNSISFSFL